MTRSIGLFSDTYTLYKTFCNSNYASLFLGSGESYEEAMRNSTIKGKGALLIGWGDDAPKLACALIKASPGKRDSDHR